MRRFWAPLAVLFFTVSLAACSEGSQSGAIPSTQFPAGNARHVSTITQIGSTTANNGYNGECIASMSGCPLPGGSDPGPGSGGDDGGGGDGTQIATQGKAVQGTPCQQPNGNSATIGTAIQGPDVQSNEVNNVYYVNVGTSNSKGSLAGNGGFFETTFGGTTWYQPPSTVPGTTSAFFVSMGSNFGITPNSPMSTATFVNLLTNALNSPINSASPSAANKSALASWLKSLGGAGPSSYVDPCFDGPWDGTPTATG